MGARRDKEEREGKGDESLGNQGLRRSWYLGQRQRRFRVVGQRGNAVRDKRD